MVQLWLEYVSIIYLTIGFASALAITYDLVVKKIRQKMKIINIVWPVNAWFLGPFGYWAYRKIGLQSVKSSSNQQDIVHYHQQKMEQKEADKSLAQKAFT